MTDEHEILLDKWANQNHHSGNGFVHDGIVDPKRWNKSKIKLLFLLKEAYSNPARPEDFDLRVLLRDVWKGPKGILFWYAAYWAYAVHNCDRTETLSLPETPEELNLASEYLLSSAIVNVKKSSGQTHSDMENIKQYAKLDGELLKKQINIINPEIVICGNTWVAVRYLWPEVISNYDLTWQNTNILFVDFWHPANQFPKKLNYYALDNILRNSLKKKKSGAG